LKNFTVKKPHPVEKKPTRSTSYRLPNEILDELENEASAKNISENVLVDLVGFFSTGCGFFTVKFFNGSVLLF
jgi:hypothetical protein